MGDFEQRVLRLFEQIHPLDRIDRAGYVLRGVVGPESVAAHSHFVSLLTLLFVDRYPEQFDRERALTMALIHDLPEAALMDIPMPAADAHLKDAKNAAERAVLGQLLGGFPEAYRELFEDLQNLRSIESRLVRGLDKAQMMIKIVMYQKEGRGRLEEFWSNPKNFADYGVSAVSDLFDAICAWAGKPRPV